MSQNNAILDYLQEGNSLTSLEALNKFQCFRLASRISDLKSAGHKIYPHPVKDERTGKRYVRYTMQAQMELKL